MPVVSMSVTPIAIIGHSPGRAPPGAQPWGPGRIVL